MGDGETSPNFCSDGGALLILVPQRQARKTRLLLVRMPVPERFAALGRRGTDLPELTGKVRTCTSERVGGCGETHGSGGTELRLPTENIPQ